MSKRPKTHFVSVSGDVALCGTNTTRSFLTNKPEQVTCAYCRRFNLQVRVRWGYAPEPRPPDKEYRAKAWARLRAALASKS